MYDRFINIKILKGLKRPQRPNECSITALGSAINAIHGTNISADDVLIASGWDIQYVTAGNVGNEEIIEVYKKMHPNGTAKIIQGLKNNETNWRYLKEQIQNKDNALIMHSNCHYNLICGYFEEPVSYEYMNNKQCRKTKKWLIIADQSNSHEPIWLLEYETMLGKIRFHRYYGIIILTAGEN
jgi:hypothetical protein